MDLVFQPKKCDHCQFLLTSFLDQNICPECKKIPYFSEQENLFFVFGMDTKFSLDPQLLSERFFEICNVLHPDRCLHLSEEEKKQAMQRMGLVNKAFETLWGSTKRRWYILDSFAPNVSSSVLSFSEEWFDLQDRIEENAQAASLIGKFFEKLTQASVDIRKQQIEIEGQFDQEYNLSLLSSLKQLSLKEKTLDALIQDVQNRLIYV